MNFALRDGAFLGRRKGSEEGAMVLMTEWALAELWLPVEGAWLER